MLATNLLSRGLLLFWTLWFSLVFASNLADGLQQTQLLPEDGPFASGNFELIAQSVGVYGLSEATAGALFCGVLLLELCAAILFWRAFLDPGRVAGNGKVHQAFCVALALFGGFLLADELFLVYRHLPGVGSTHFLVLCALLLSLLLAERAPS
jgi:hypothetical protein